MPLNTNEIEELSLLRSLAMQVENFEFADGLADLYDEGGAFKRSGYGAGWIFRELDRLAQSNENYTNVEQALADETKDACTSTANLLRSEHWKVIQAIQWWLSQPESHESGEALNLLIGDLTNLQVAERSLRTVARGFAYRNHVKKE